MLFNISGPPARGGGSRPGTGGSVCAGGYANGFGNEHMDETARRQDMLLKGYLPTEDYIGIMELNKELLEQNKNLRSESIKAKVEHEKLRVDEAFLRGNVLAASLEPPPEVPPPDGPDSLT